MSFMVVHTKLYERVQCLLQGRLFGLVRRLCIVAHRVGPGVLYGSLIISTGEVWMTPPTRVICVCIRIETLPRLISIHEIDLLWLIYIL